MHVWCRHISCTITGLLITMSFTFCLHWKAVFSVTVSVVRGCINSCNPSQTFTGTVFSQNGMSMNGKPDHRMLISCENRNWNSHGYHQVSGDRSDTATSNLRRNVKIKQWCLQNDRAATNSNKNIDAFWIIIDLTSYYTHTNAEKAWK